MCILMPDEDESEGGAKLQTKGHHTWIIPQRIVWVILGLAITFFFLGMVFMAIGGGAGIAALSVLGGIMFGIGIIGVILCLLVCLYAYFVFGTKNQAMQTDTNFPSTMDMTDGPEYASIRRSALKSGDSTLRKNGTLGNKKVTIAPDAGPTAGSSSSNNQSGISNGPHSGAQTLPNMTSQGQSRFYRGNSNVSTTSSIRSTPGDVGTGGIQILPQEPPFPTVPDPVYQPGTPSVVYSRGGSSASSVVDSSFTYPQSDHHSISHDSGITDTSQRSLRHVSISPAPSGSESQYSTLRSIPVTHIISESQMEQMKQQQSQGLQNQQPQRVSTQSSTSSQSSPISPQLPGFKPQNMKGYRQQVLSADLQDFDYDIPEDRASLISHKSGQSSSSYHEQQMNYQRQKRQQELQAARQGNTYGHQEHHHQTQSHRTVQSPQFVTIQEDQVPESQPLVHPPVRRPMTFEQISSSKMSMYDNAYDNIEGDKKV